MVRVVLVETTLHFGLPDGVDVVLPDGAEGLAVVAVDEGVEFGYAASMMVQEEAESAYRRVYETAEREHPRDVPSTFVDVIVSRSHDNQDQPAAVRSFT